MYDDTPGVDVLVWELRQFGECVNPGCDIGRWLGNYNKKESGADRVHVLVESCCPGARCILYPTHKAKKSGDTWQDLPSFPEFAATAAFVLGFLLQYAQSCSYGNWKALQDGAWLCLSSLVSELFRLAVASGIEGCDVRDGRIRSAVDGNLVLCELLDYYSESTALPFFVDVTAESVPIVVVLWLAARIHFLQACLPSPGLRDMVAGVFACVCAQFEFRGRSRMRPAPSYSLVQCQLVGPGGGKRRLDPGLRRALSRKRYAVQICADMKDEGLNAIGTCASIREEECRRFWHRFIDVFRPCRTLEYTADATDYRRACDIILVYSPDIDVAAYAPPKDMFGMR